jgi:DNA-binding NtrC family response regulator
MARIRALAKTSTAVLITGESGTGKELIAQALHELGPTRVGPLVAVDCAALSPNLVASELFGHERGAFTGADRPHAGAFERARGGTLFLDEIGEVPLGLQSCLLGVLERRSFRRVGGKADLPLDARIIAATNRDLREGAHSGRFRLDLYHRLAVVVLFAPPLRERLDDIPILVEHFLRKSGHAGPSALFDEKTLRSLSERRWPGNVRELRNWVEATLALGEPPPLEEDAPPPKPSADAISAVLHLPYKQARARLLWEFEERYLQEQLERSSGNVSRAARQSGMDRTYLISLLQRHQLDRIPRRGAPEPSPIDSRSISANLMDQRDGAGAYDGPRNRAASLPVCPSDAPADIGLVRR